VTNPIDAHRGPTYFVWLDSNKKVATSTKIANAIKRFEDKHGRPPEEVLIHATAAGTRSPVPLRVEHFVKEHYFYLPIPDT
jgi:hypothetical protein